ncbi:MAG TPA: hypothetical protein VFU16_01005 [Solirubrobacterales bacterium]|nr:hypothetical protein [Solirubrobacterales bacterium]
MPLRKLLIPVLALTSLLAFASAARATTFFDAGYYPAELKGAQTTTLVFKVDGQAAQCNSATFSGTQNEPLDAIELEASFSNCTAFGFSGATVTMNTCKFKPNADTSTNGFICGETPIKIKSSAFGSTCEVQIGESGNTKLSKFSASTVNSSPKTVSGKFELTGMAANKTADTGLCPLSGAGNTNNATLNGTIALEAIGAGAKVKFVVEAFAPPVLCKVNTAPCAAEDTYPVNTSMRAQVTGAERPTFKFDYDKVAISVKCEESELQPTTDANGVATLNAVVNIFSFSKCNGKEEKCTVATSPKYKMMMLRSEQAQGNGRVEIVKGGGGADPTFTINCEHKDPCAYVAPVLAGNFKGGNQNAELKLDKREGINPAPGNAAKCGPSLTFENDLYNLLEPQEGEPENAIKGIAFLISS